MKRLVNAWVKITPEGIVLNGKRQDFSKTGKQLLVEAYRVLGDDYPKFFKMDALSRLGYIASELLLHGEENRFIPREDRAVVMFNRSGSVVTDTDYQQTLDKDNYFPSPAIFVYTLPNIVTGEISIRNKYYGESSFYVLDTWKAKEIVDVVMQSFEDRQTTSVLCGWLDAYSNDDFEALVLLVSDEEQATPMTDIFSEEKLSFYKNIN